MDLFGAAKKNPLSFGKWYLEYPDFWCKNRDFIRKRPFPKLINRSWRGIDTSEFLFYHLNAELMDFNKVFDLRSPHWKEKIHTFITWYGTGWVSPGGMDSCTSPLEHVMYLGNYHVLAARGYRWVAMNHGPNKKNEYVELWCYVNVNEHPKKYYEISILSAEEFLR